MKLPFIKASNGHTDLMDKIAQHISRVQKTRMEWERKAYINTMYKEGHHWVNDAGLVDNRDPNKLRRHVNKFRSTLRSLKNSITFNDPKIDVLPERGQENVDQDELEVASYVLTGEYEKNNVKDKAKTLIDDAACKTWAVWSVTPNKDPDDDRLVNIVSHDSFDVLWDTNNFQKSQMIVCTSAESKEELRGRGFVNLDKIKESATRSLSVLKNEFEKIEGNNPNPDKILMQEVYYMQHDDVDTKEKEVDEEGNERYKKESKSKVMYCVKSGDTIIYEPEELKGYKHLGQIFFIYYMEKNEHIPYSTPWMSDAIPLQRSLNDASEDTDTMLNSYAKVRMKQKNTDSNDIQMFEDKHLQIIRYKENAPEFVDSPSIPPALFEQVKIRESQIEDMVGMHAASMGKLADSGASGRLQALMMAGDMDNVAEPVSNLQTFLAAVFKQVIEVAADNVTEAMRVYGEDQNRSFLAIGEKAWETLSDTEKVKTKKIKKFTNLRIIIVPGNQFGVVTAKQEIMDVIPILAQAGLTDEVKVLFDVLLRKYGLGATRDIAKSIQLKHDEAQMKNADVKIVEFEIVKLMRGEVVTATPEQNHKMHIEMKMLAVQSLVDQQGEEAPGVMTMLGNISQHKSMMGAMSGMQPQPTA